MPKIRTTVRKDLEAFISELARNKMLLQSGSWIPAANETLIQKTYELFMRSYLEGMADVGISVKEMADAVPKPLQFDEAIAFAKTRVTLAKSDYKKLSDLLRYRAWTVGRLAQIDAIEKVRSHYLAQLEGNASSLEEFIKSIEADDALIVAGFGEQSPWYYETVYRTNIMTDYNAGRAQAFKLNRPVALEFVGIEDSRQTSICATRTGIVLPYTDPWWETNWPPLHYNCRSTIRPIYREEAEKTGLDIKVLQKTKIPLEASKAQPVDGFGRNPVLDNEFWAPTTHQQGRIIKALIQEELNMVAGETVCADFKLPRSGWVIDDVPSKGGVRYPESLVKESEFHSNLELSRVLAARGYFVELRRAEKLLGNRQFDAWVNASERWEFKAISSKSVRQISREIGTGSLQAQRLLIGLSDADQIDPLATAIGSRIAEIKTKGRMLAKLAVAYGDQFVELGWKDMQNPETVTQTLTKLIR